MYRSFSRLSCSMRSVLASCSRVFARNSCRSPRSWIGSPHAVRMRCTHAVRMRCTHAVHTCGARMRCTHAVHACGAHGMLLDESEQQRGDER